MEGIRHGYKEFASSQFSITEILISIFFLTNPHIKAGCHKACIHNHSYNQFRLAVFPGQGITWLLSGFELVFSSPKMATGLLKVLGTLPSSSLKRVCQKFEISPAQI